MGNLPTSVIIIFGVILIFFIKFFIDRQKLLRNYTGVSAGTIYDRKTLINRLWVYYWITIVLFLITIYILIHA